MHVYVIAVLVSEEGDVGQEREEVVAEKSEGFLKRGIVYFIHGYY